MVGVRAMDEEYNEFATVYELMTNEKWLMEKARCKMTGLTKQDGYNNYKCLD
jgi:hypothetical protein